MKRRSFIEKSSLLSAAAFSSFNIPSLSQDRKIKVGLIGSGWYGLVITKAALNAGGVDVIGVCDVDSEHLKKGADELEGLQGSRPKTFSNYNELLDMEGLEAVLIGSPPHWHALQFIAACEKGLDIYCEKPLSYDIKEGMAMLEAASKAGNIVQVGFQRRQSNAFKKAKDMIEGGDIGKVHQVEAQIHYNPNLKDHTVQNPPASLDWDAWCGPAPMLEYRPIIGHMAWRLEKEYGNGHLVDWGIHHIDITRKILNLGMPSKVQSTGDLITLKGKITTPDTLRVQFDFDGIPVFWQHRLWGSGDLNTQFNNGVFFYGEKATLFASDRKLVMMPAGKDQEQETMEIKTEGMQEKHLADFIQAVKLKDKSKITCSVEDALQSTTTVHLAMMSYESGSEVNWDVESMNVQGNEKASKMMARSYRAGYQRPS